MSFTNRVIGVTRSPHKVDTLLEAGMMAVIVSSSVVADQVLNTWPQGATGIVETITSAETIYNYNSDNNSSKSS